MVYSKDTLKSAKQSDNQSILHQLCWYNKILGHVAKSVPPTQGSSWHTVRAATIVAFLTPCLKGEVGQVAKPVCQCAVASCNPEGAQLLPSGARYGNSMATTRQPYAPIRVADG